MEKLVVDHNYPHIPSTDEAIIKAHHKTHEIAVRKLRDELNRFISSPTPYGCDALLGAARSLLQEEFYRLRKSI